MSRFPNDISAEFITVVARRVLLDAVEALHAHRDAITLVGAQAVHLRTAASELTTASYTSDADPGVDPEVLDERFRCGIEVGRWWMRRAR
ncbi:MAG: hypothetical protein ACRDRU_26945 [Pseudonocardiaceae bacterium]